MKVRLYLRIRFSDGARTTPIQSTRPAVSSNRDMLSRLERGSIIQKASPIIYWATSTAGKDVMHLVMKLMILAFVRTSELIDATWSEFDLERAGWHIPERVHENENALHRSVVAPSDRNV